MKKRRRAQKTALLASALILSACASGGGSTQFTPTSSNSTGNNSSTSGGTGGAGSASGQQGQGSAAGDSSNGTNNAGAGIVAKAIGGNIDITAASGVGAYGSYYGTSAWTDGGAGSYGDSAYLSRFEIGAPDEATLGSNATPIVVSQESDPNFLDTSSNGTDFPLVQVVIEITEIGTAPHDATNEGGATLSIIDVETGELNLSIPSLGIEVSLFANADDPTAVTNGFASLAGATGNWLLVGSWGAGIDDTGYAASFVTGYRTPTDAIPTSGTANFTGSSNVVGSVLIEGADNSVSLGFLLGDASFVADFAAGTVDGAFTNMMATGLDGEATNWNDVSVEASLSSAGGVSTLNGTTGASSAPSAAPFALGSSSAGHINGGLFGPNAEELGAVWSLSDGNGAALGTVGAGAAGTGGGGSAGINAQASGGADVTINDTTTP